MPKQNNVAAALRAIADSITGLTIAVREHTDHVKEDDERWWDSKNEDKNPGDTEEGDSMKPADDAFAHYSRLRQGPAGGRELEDPEDPLPAWVVELMQSTPHQFVREPWRARRSYRTGQFTRPRCRVCQLPQGNPVHQVLLPEFRTNYRDED